MQSIVLVVHVLLAVVIIGLVLMQHGKGADAGAAFGSGASATVFGARGAASFLTRATTATAFGFFVTSVVLFWIAAHRDGAVRSVTDSVTDVPGLVDEAPAPLPATDLPDALEPAGGEAPPAPDDVPPAPADAPAEPAAGQALPAAPEVAPAEPAAVPAPAIDAGTGVETPPTAPATD